MANTIQLKRRVSGVAGAPAALKSGEIAHNEVDATLYVGTGDDGSGNATSIVALAGSDAFAALAGAQTIGGAKTFSLVPKSSQDASGATDLVRKSQLDAGLAARAALASPAFTGTPTAPTAVAGTNSTQIATTAFVNEAIAGFGAGDMAKSTYDTDNDGKVGAAEVADAVPWAGITGKPTGFTPSMPFNARCWTPPAAALVAATIFLTGCTRGDSELGGPCPPVVEYSRGEQTRLADEVARLPEASLIPEWLADYAVMRDQARVCAGLRASEGR